ncbi:CopG family transcriptional regulator [Nitrosococcus wardiae]|uniref:CopG family transcriptional regulator n=1 Tax=Nitrosococcus wardiae TaxID=1814290 RepID=A0A4P7BUS9_9GAMM|nr:CopG family transcriptional regulator [Nitrosococcus wardiae]
MAKETLNIRIDPELRAKLVKMAKKQNRPLSNLAETLLWEAVKRESMAKGK